MDPITKALEVLCLLLEFALEIYKNLPQALREQQAVDWATFFHNISKQILFLQGQLTPVDKPAVALTTHGTNS